MAAFQAEINRATDSQRKEIRIGCVQSRRKDLCEHIQSREGYWVAHQGQVDELFNRAAAKLYPDLLIFASRVFLRRMRRPFDAQMPEVIKTGGDRAVRPIESRVQIDT